MVPVNEITIESIYCEYMSSLKHRQKKSTMDIYIEFVLTKITDKMVMARPNFTGTESCAFLFRVSHRAQQMEINTDVAMNSITNASVSVRSSCGAVWQTPYGPVLRANTFVGVSAFNSRNPSVAPINWASKYRKAICTMEYAEKGEIKTAPVKFWLHFINRKMSKGWEKRKNHLPEWMSCEIQQWPVLQPDSKITKFKLNKKTTN